MKITSQAPLRGTRLKLYLYGRKPMAELAYTLGISLLRTIYRVAAWFSPKAAAFRKGRKDQVDTLKAAFPQPPPQTPLVWFHCSSLGEFEQARPVIELLKSWRPEIRVLLTFFSPSGYEVRKDYTFADYVFYLPWDTHSNAKWFAENVRPALAVFVKYEFWYHYSRALKANNIPIISISAIFRPDQIYFKPLGAFFRGILRNFSFFFVQNQESVDLLNTIGISSTLAGDTRFDRVNEIAKQADNNPLAVRFKDGKKLMVIGSAWPKDMDVLIPFINKNLGTLKFIIAPHEIEERFLSAIESEITGNIVRYSRTKDSQVVNADVLLVDQMGLLAQLYRYSEFAFVGGGYREGLHNILEAACYGIPIFFGDKAIGKFQEATDLIKLGGAFSVRDTPDLDETYQLITRTNSAYQQACSTTREYVAKNLGATAIIVDRCKQTLEAWKGAY